MKNIAASVEEFVGNTPLLECVRLRRQEHLAARILVKLEMYNPGGSAKDRAALSMLDAAERDGRLKPGGVILEPTSGNTGIGLALYGSLRGFRVVIVMPENMSVERRMIMSAYGARVVLSPAAGGMSGAIRLAQQLAETEYPVAFIPGQFDNPDNPRAHRETTGPEIWRACGGDLDFFVAAVGTGGTITGAGEYLKAQDPSVRVIAVEPAGSPVLSGGKPGPHAIAGIGAGFVPGALNPSVYDRVIPVTDGEAAEAARLLAATEGILAGISSGAALAAAMKIAAQPENAEKTIVTLLPDGGEKYLSTGLFAAPEKTPQEGKI